MRLSTGAVVVITGILACVSRSKAISVLGRYVIIAAGIVAIGIPWVAETHVAQASGPNGVTASDRLTPSLVTVARLEWHTDYAVAYQAARSSKRMLLLNFLPSRSAIADNNQANQGQRSLEKTITGNDALRKLLDGVVRVRLAWDTKIQLDGKLIRLLSNAAFQHLEDQPGIVMVDLVHTDAPYYGRTVSAFPFRSGKYYRWKPEYLSVALNLPPGTITQRTMVWAVRIHPERPASTTGKKDSGLAQAAESHSQHQANLGLQGHHQWETRFHQVRSMVGTSTASEVVAESWPGENMIDSCIDCVSSWRHSSGHWRAVRKRHRFYGYDIRRGRNGIWYGTGIFAN